MVKKLKKCVKFVVCCALMLSLMAPSYAALSSSDGSAFVTKAEFDSALADFNARLTTFEAGINSKIDSQVTSYLDRNGIWSGKSQGVEGLMHDYDCDEIMARVTDANKKTFYYRQYTNTVTASKEGSGFIPLDVSIEWPFISKVNKSGLLVMSFYVRQTCYCDPTAWNYGPTSTVGGNYNNQWYKKWLRDKSVSMHSIEEDTSLDYGWMGLFIANTQNSVSTPTLNINFDVLLNDVTKNKILAQGNIVKWSNPIQGHAQNNTQDTSRNYSGGFALPFQESPLLLIFNCFVDKEHTLSLDLAWKVFGRNPRNYCWTTNTGKLYTVVEIEKCEVY